MLSLILRGLSEVLQLTNNEIERLRPKIEEFLESEYDLNFESLKDFLISLVKKIGVNVATTKAIDLLEWILLKGVSELRNMAGSPIVIGIDEKIVDAVKYCINCVRRHGVNTAQLGAMLHNEDSDALEKVNDLISILVSVD